MKLTIRDIAKMANVSPATVSKILNNTGSISKETRDKVMAIVEQTGYRPTFSAKSLATKKSNLIGIIYAGKVNVDFTHPFFNPVVNTFKKTVGREGYDLLVFSNETFSLEKENYLARCRHFHVDGCLIIAGEEVEEAIYELDQSDIPCAGIDIELTGNRSRYVMTDNFKIPALVVEYFYMNSIREIAYIGGLASSKIGEMRRKGFLEAMEKYGMPVREQWMKYGDFYEDSGYRAMNEILEGKSHPKAVFAASDMMALGAMRAIKEKGLKIPEDINVVGCDDIEACRYSDPQLTTVRQDKEKLGMMAARMLLELIHGENGAKSVLIDPEFIVRESSIKGL